MLTENEYSAEDDYDYSAPPPIDPVRLEAVKHRIIDAHSKGVSLKTLAGVAGIDGERLKLWLDAPNSMPWFGRRVGEKSAPEKILDAMEEHFSALDAKGIDLRDRCPVSVETSVTRAILYGITTARTMCEPVLIDAPSGVGKTESIRRYLVQARKTEGFDCPVWRIVLSESAITVTAVLALLAREVFADCGYGKKSDAAVSQAILEATRGRDGVLIIDEAQHLGDALKINGIRILNELRTMNDSGNFGMALFGNGEIYGRLNATTRGKSNFAQISSRVNPFRIEVAGLGQGKGGQPALTESDVLAVVHAWGAGGAEIEQWALRVACKSGALRHVSVGLRHSMLNWGSIRLDALEESERLRSA